MSDVGQRERATQNRVVKLFQDQLDYTYLGNWEDGERTMPVEDVLLCNYLEGAGYDGKLIQRALEKFYKEMALGEGRNLYDVNKAVYDLLRYGVKVKTGSRIAVFDLRAAHFKRDILSQQNLINRMMKEFSCC